MDRSTGTGIHGTGQAQCGLRFLVIGARHWPADRHGDGGGHRRNGGPIQGRMRATSPPGSD